jgi:hypothetical protein
MKQPTNFLGALDALSGDYMQQSMEGVQVCWVV